MRIRTAIAGFAFTLTTVLTATAGPSAVRYTNQACQARRRVRGPFGRQVVLR